MNLNQAQYLKFDTAIYLTNGQGEYLFSRGFIDSTLHLAKQIEEQITPECEFRIQQKNYLARDQRKINKSQSVVFGTEIFLRHVYSNEYICIELGEDGNLWVISGNEILCLRERPSEECYFQILPQRTFEHKGDFVTLHSTFVIRHSKYKCYIGSNLQNEPFKQKIQQRFKNSKVMQSYRMMRRKESLLQSQSHGVQDLNNSLQHDNSDRSILEEMEKRQNLIEEFRRAETSLIRIPSTPFEQVQVSAYDEKDFFLPLSTASVPRQQLKGCLIEKHVHTMWHVEVKQAGKHSFLCDNDYIYFISSNKNRGLMNINHKTRKIEFIRNQGDNEYVCSAIFIVQMVNKDTIYLKHLLTGKYFPFNEFNHKKKIKLVPLLPLSATENKLPPFHLYIDGQFYPKQIMDDQHTCGFWLNKVNKLQINEILSLQGISHRQWIPYLIKYLDNHRKRHQQILQQFRFINFLMESMIPYQSQKEQTYHLLFKMINMNASIRREMIEYITQILQEDKKESIIDILSEMLDNQDNLSEKYINAHQLQYVVKEFMREDLYSITYMRIFRLFCGHESQTCQRNQNAIFNLFFAEKNNNNTRNITQSIVTVEKHQLPSKYKCKINIKKQGIFFLTGEQSLRFNEIAYEQQEFIRQYFYLMGDCIKLNKDNAKLFKQDNSQCYSLQNLLYVLESPELERLRGPILNLINAIYLQPEYRYKLYVFLPEYENMCYNGSLVALNQSETIDRLIHYILKQIEAIRVINEEIASLIAFQQKHKQRNQQIQNRLDQLYDHIKNEYKSTKFKHLLVMITLTIQNSYWNNITSLFHIVDTLAKLYRNKKDINLQGQSNYEQINEWKNYMDSTILSIRIAILFLDIQINLCISNLITLPQNKVQQQINSFVTKIQNDKQVKYDFNSFQLCDTQNPELIKKSLILSRKFYEIKSIILQKYEEAVCQRRSTKKMKEQIELIKDTIDRLKLSNEESIDVCKRYIKNCMEDVDIEELLPGELVKYGYVLNSIYKYKQMVPEFQVLAYKLGVLELLSEDLNRYINLRVKEKPMERISIYWKLMLLYVLIKGNEDLRREATPWRSWLINLLCQQNEISILAIDLLSQLYHDNRNIIVSDVEQISIICQTLMRLLQIDNKHQLCNSNFLNIKIIKLINLISIFLVIQGKKIKNNYQVVTNELFDKDNVIQYILKLKSIDHFKARHDHDQNHISNHHLFQILLYQLTETLEQKPEKMGFSLPSLGQMLSLIIAIGRKNWLLTFKIMSCIQPKHINSNKFDEQHMLIKVLRSIINSICQLIFQYYRKNPGEERYGISNNAELTIIFAHFPLLVKITKIVLVNTFAENKNSESERGSTKHISLIKDKLYLLERLFLFRPYMNKQISDKLTNLANSNKQLLGLDDCQIDFLHQLSISYFSYDQIKQQRKLIDLVATMPNKNHSPLMQISSYFKSKTLRFEPDERLSWSKMVAENSHLNNTSTFSINEAKQFIKSLIYINKSDSKILDTDLKSFFISFLISTFPNTQNEVYSAYAYSQALVAHQKILIGFGTAELISIILQQKFRQSYNLFINVFELGNKLLESGNEQNQQQFLKIFKCDHKNIIFENITLIIQNSLMGIRFYYYYNKNESGKSKELDVTYSFTNQLQIGKEKKQVCEILKKIFRFLQLLCENDNQNLKKYIFSQVNQDNVVKYMSINFIEIAINILIQFVDIISFNLTAKLVEGTEVSSNLIDVVFYILQFLIEVCQYPAIKNQVYLCNTDFFNVIRVITELKKTTLNSNFSKQTNKDIFTIERKIVLLLRGLLEERNPEIIETLSKKLEVQDLKELIKQSFKLIGVQTKSQLDEYLNTKDDRLIEQIQNVVDILIVSKVLGFSIENYFVNEEKEILIEVNKKIREIEVNFKGQLTNIYFCYRPIFGYLSESTKIFFINKSSEHESRNQKLRDLINSRHIVNQDILNRKSRQLIMSEKGITNMFDFSVWLCFVLISLQLFFFTVNKMGIAMDQMETNIVQGLALMEFIVAVIYFILWGVNISPITKQKLKEKHKYLQNQPIFQWKVYYLLFKQIYFEESTSLHALLLLMLSFISCFFELRLYSLVILYIFAKIELLSSILTAIRLTWGKLLIVCLLATAFSFIFGFLSINNYIKVLYQNESIDIDIEHITSHCTTIITCIESLYTQRIIGESPSREGDSSHYGRFFSDVIYWAFFDILLTNIIAAIIIDKFAQLRNKKQKIQNQKRNRCFICYADKSSIERKNQDFDHHIDYKHSIWDYFYYLYYLQKLKSHTEFTGIEYWIAKQVKSNMIEWFPIDEYLKEDYSEKKMNVMFELFRKKLETEKESGEE